MQKAFIMIAAAASVAFAAPPPAARPPLTAQQKAAIDSIRNVYRIPGCAGTLARNAREAAACPMAAHLDTFLTWVAGIESTTTAIGAQLDNRYKALVCDSVMAIDTAGYPALGDPHAPVLAVLYASSLCPLCKYVLSGILAAMDGGPLAHAVRLVVKPFAGAPGDRAFMAALAMGKAWDLERVLSHVKERTDQRVVMRIADSIGLDTTRLKPAMNDPAVSRKLEASRDEGKRNGVSVTPGIFINRHPYHNYKDPQWVIDALQYAVEMQKARKR